MPASSIAYLVGRGLLASLFILAGASKIVAPAPVLAHMAQERVPAIALPLVIVVEIGCGVAILMGWNVAAAAGVLSLFCLATAVVFHRNLAERTERAQFFKDIALAGGLAVLAAGAM